jgi:hypothetical protein
MAFEGPPGLDFQAKREVESRVTLNSEEERVALEEQAVALGGVPNTAELYDEGFDVEGLIGRARIRRVTPSDGSEPYFEWSVKVKVPESTTKIVKAPFEYQGQAATHEEAEAALYAFLVEYLHRDPVLTLGRTYEHRRTTYTLPNGVTVSVDTFTNVDGTELKTPNESVELEILLPEDATPEAIAEAEKKIIETAIMLGIPVDRLSSESNRKVLLAAAA